MNLSVSLGHGQNPLKPYVSVLTSPPERLATTHLSTPSISTARTHTSRLPHTSNLLGEDRESAPFVPLRLRVESALVQGLNLLGHCPEAPGNQPKGSWT